MDLGLNGNAVLITGGSEGIAFVRRRALPAERACLAVDSRERSSVDAALAPMCARAVR